MVVRNTIPMAPGAPLDHNRYEFSPTTLMTGDQSMTHPPQRPALVLTEIGTYLPDTRESNASIATALAVSDDFIRSKIGITTRAVKSSTQRTSDMCV